MEITSQLCLDLLNDPKWSESAKSKLYLAAGLLRISEAIEQQTKTLTGSLNDIFSGISDLKGKEMSPEQQASGIVSEQESKRPIDELDRAITIQGHQILALQKQIDSVQTTISAHLVYDRMLGFQTEIDTLKQAIDAVGKDLADLKRKSQG